MSNSVDPDQLASSEANLSGSTLFVKAGYIKQGSVGLGLNFRIFQVKLADIKCLMVFLFPIKLGIVDILSKEYVLNEKVIISTLQTKTEIPMQTV